MAETHRHVPASNRTHLPGLCPDDTGTKGKMRWNFRKDLAHHQGQLIGAQDLKLKQHSLCEQSSTMQSK